MEISTLQDIHCPSPRLTERISPTSTMLLHDVSNHQPYMWLSRIALGRAASNGFRMYVLSWNFARKWVPNSTKNQIPTELRGADAQTWPMVARHLQIIVTDFDAEATMVLCFAIHLHQVGRSPHRQYSFGHRSAEHGDLSHMNRWRNCKLVSVHATTTSPKAVEDFLKICGNSEWPDYLWSVL